MWYGPFRETVSRIAGSITSFFTREPATDMAPQQVSLSGVIICPDQELEQRFAVNSFTVHLSDNYSEGSKVLVGVLAFVLGEDESAQRRTTKLPESRNGT